MHTLRWPLLLFLMLLVLVTQTAADTSPPASAEPSGPQTEYRDDAVTAVVVKSWGTGSGSLIWQYLNDSWNLFGSVQVVIDHTSLHDVSSFTLEDLQANGADVVIVSDPAGGFDQWTADEVAALQAYAEQGHRLVGTFLLFQWMDFDNRGLAPLWGLRSDLDYNTMQIDAEPSTHIIDSTHCLFCRISEPFEMGGWPFVQVPVDDSSWNDGDLAGAVMLGRSTNGRNVVTGFDAGNYQAYYISFMPEYLSGTTWEAVQWLYNAIVCGEVPSPTERVTWGTLKQRFE
jgi:hypothetical protein